MKTWQNLLLILLLVTVLACGKKGSPRPPEDLRPNLVRYVTATGAVDGLDISWVPPETKVAGGALDDLDGFILKRAVVVNDQPGRFQIIARIRYETQLGNTAQQERLTYRDRDLRPGQKYDYLLSAYNSESDIGPASSPFRVLFKGQSSEVEVLE